MRPRRVSESSLLILPANDLQRVMSLSDVWVASDPCKTARVILRYILLRWRIVAVSAGAYLGQGYNTQAVL